MLGRVKAGAAGAAGRAAAPSRAAVLELLRSPAKRAALFRIDPDARGRDPELAVKEAYWRWAAERD